MDPVGDLPAELVVAPAGVALLETLEAQQAAGGGESARFGGSDRLGVVRAVEAVHSMGFGQLARSIVHGAEEIGGPWRPDAVQRLVAAYGCALDRSAIAEAVADRFGELLSATLSLGDQQWWNHAQGLAPIQSMGDGSAVYCCGEFTWSALWTVTAPDNEVHDDLVDVWELFPGPISRWQLPVLSTARIMEIHRPSDWADLVATYPRFGRPHQGWELPGPNHDPVQTRKLRELSNGAAARTSVRVAMPDWTRVGAEFDGVHLSWAGKLTCEGRVIDVPALGSDVVSMVRYWGSERTLWLNDVFGSPQPAPAPALSGRINRDLGIDATDPVRHDRDLDALTSILQR